MSLDGGFAERMNEFLKQRIEARYANAPSAEQVEHHLAAAERLCDIVNRVVIEFVYEVSWLEENGSRHHALNDDALGRLVYLRRRCRDFMDMLEPPGPKPVEGGPPQPPAEAAG
jgi:hypothetical protein